MGGQDTVVLWATAGGKSLCYQLFAVHIGAIVVVVQPLIALMKDQVEEFNKRMEDMERELGLEGEEEQLPRRRACYLGTSQTDPSIEQAAIDGEFLLIYVTPEKVAQTRFLDAMRAIYEQGDLAMFAVDEAHCISHWGNDFRPAYRELNFLREEYPRTVMMALTAVPTKVITDDILKWLVLREPFESRTTMDRPNLRISRKRKLGFDADMVQIADAITDNPGRSIVYVRTQVLTSKVADALKELLPEIGIAPYHADMDMEVRTQTQEAFSHGGCSVIVATVALGMGMNWPDIRNVIQYGAPTTVEEYYQQIGRAGRDGNPSACITISEDRDLDRINIDGFEEWMRTSSSALRDFMATGRCRRRWTVEYFSEVPKYEHCGNCDNCLQRKEEKRSVDSMMRVALLVLNATAARPQKITGIIQLCSGRWKPNSPRWMEKSERAILDAMPIIQSQCKTLLGPKAHWEPAIREVIPWLCSEKLANRILKQEAYPRGRLLTTLYEITDRGRAWLGGERPPLGPTPPELSEMMARTSRRPERPRQYQPRAESKAHRWTRSHGVEALSLEDLMALGAEELEASITVVKLQELLKARGLKVSGRKADLIARLRASL